MPWSRLVSSTRGQCFGLVGPGHSLLWVYCSLQGGTDQGIRLNLNSQSNQESACNQPHPPPQPPKCPHAHWMAIASMEIEASDGLHAVNAQLSGHPVQVRQGHLDTADGHHAGQEEVHVPKLIPRHLQRRSCQSSWMGDRAAHSDPHPHPQSCPYLPINSYRRLILFCLPVTIEAQVIVVMQLGLREPGFPGTVREAFHHLLQRKQPGYKKCFLLKDSAHARY